MIPLVDSDDEIERIRAKKLAELMEQAHRQAVAATVSAGPIVVTDANFAEVVKKSRLVLVDFWATWCQPCKVIAPNVEELGRKYAGKLVVAKMDVDSNRIIPGRFGIQSIPTLMLFKDSEAVDGIIGAVPRAQIEGLVTKWM